MKTVEKKTGDPSDPHSLFSAYAQKMAADGAPAIVINAFKEHFRQFCNGNQAYLSEAMISPVLPDEIPEMQTLGGYKEAGYTALPRTAILKLNGGLGTSMGLEGPKSFLPVREGRSFLDLILSQVDQLRKLYDAPLPLLLMNSFWTEEPTRERLHGLVNGDPHIPMTFMQHRYPRIRKDTLAPLTFRAAPELEWNPPGHGDIYTALLTTGLLRKLLLNGYRYVFVSNSDNLGATFDASLLGYMVKEEIPFLMEVCQRTAHDRKGGHLVKLGGAAGPLGLREVAQCSPEDMDAFQDIDNYSFFNTNSIWLDLRAVERAFLKYKQFALQLIVNPKRVVPGDTESPWVYQLETAMGSALSMFDGARAVMVPRNRFSPVKTISDLMLTMSDCFQVTDDNSVIRANAWRELPKITLDPNIYSTIDSFFARFPQGVPSLEGCRELSIHGDVRFQADVKLNGEVRIVNTSQRQAVIPPGHNLSGEIAIA